MLQPSRGRQLTKAEIRLVRRLWAEGVAVTVICNELRITRDAFNARRLDQLADLPALRRGCRNGIRRCPEPTEEDFPPELIAARAAEIRAGWSEEERMRRMGCGVSPVNERVVTRSSIRAAISNR